MKLDDDIGLTTGAVEIRDYCERWPMHFDNERRIVAGALGSSALAIEHIGSTSVPGLAAKPIIDIGVGVDSFEDAIALVDPMVAIGYEYMGEFGIARRHYYRKGDPRTHQIHMFEISSNAWRDHIAFRDYLQTHPQTAADYERLKRRLADQHPTDRDAYTDAKSDFIHSVLAVAR